MQTRSPGKEALMIPAKCFKAHFSVASHPSVARNERNNVLRCHTSPLLHHRHCSSAFENLHLALEGSTARTPSAPTPRWRSQSSATREASKESAWLRLSIMTKSLPAPFILVKESSMTAETRRTWWLAQVGARNRLRDRRGQELCRFPRSPDDGAPNNDRIRLRCDHRSLLGG